MSDTASLVQSAIAESTPVAETEPIVGDETPAAETASDDTPLVGAEPSDTPAEDAAPAAVVEAPKKRRGPIPYDRHEAVLTRARGEHEKALKALRDEFDGYKSKYDSNDTQTKLKLMDLLESNPAQAIAVLKQVDAERFAKLSWAEEVAAAAASAAPEIGEMPAPDALSPDGNMGYTAEGAQKLVQFYLAQERAENKKALDALRAELKPITTEHQARVAFGESVQRMKPVLENARQSWPKFTEHEAEIRQHLADNPRATLHDSYIAVVTAKLVAATNDAEATARKKLIAEMNKNGKVTGVIPGKIPAAGAPEGGDGEPRSTADLVRAALKSAA